MINRRSTIAVMVLAMAACANKGDGPPEIEVDRTPCAHCTMLISEPRFAAAYNPQTGDRRVFDDIGCLLDDVAAQHGVAPERIWFHDAGGSGWIEGTNAVFVRSAELSTPMSGGLTAYRDRGAAEAAADSHHGQLIGTFTELMAERNRRVTQ